MLLEARNISKTFHSKQRGAPVHAVKGVSLQSRPGEFVAIVGESGSGKSTVARMLLDLIPVTSGTVELDGTRIGSMNRRERSDYRRSVQAVLQDPAGSLNPRKRVQQAIGEIVRFHGLASRQAEIRAIAIEALQQVGLSPAETILDRFPHELSGGQRQRVLIARALVLNPSIIVADEAVSALDASVKAGVLRVMAELKDRLGVGYVFITHDLPIVEKVADRVYVMRAGEVVEEGMADEVFSNPSDDYTRTLLAATPVLPPLK
ncbi:MAG: ABC transporter ATP-binding protein [Pseudoclavibacter sp.]